ncbi:MAG: ROK family protein [Deinococcus sp.]|nr:ROK family protein [Deinococcus sp.]
MRAIGIDLGGTKIAAGLVDLDTGAVLRRTIIPSEGDKGPQVVMDRMADAARQVMEGKIVGVGVGAPGPVNYQGVVLWTPNLGGWKNIPVAPEMERRLELPTRADNDANLAAWAEYRFGAARPFASFFYLTISTGIGCGIVLNRQVWRGHHGWAGETGHMPVVRQGRKCGCGSYGCWETVASGTAIGRAGSEALGRPVDAKAIFQLAAQGDAEAQKVLDEAIDYVALGLTSLQKNFDLEAVIIGGGVSRAGDAFFIPLRQKTLGYLRHMVDEVIILPAQLGEEVGIIGAAALWT